jgi:membrane fusion protein (multidrug efflux system)
VYAVIVRLTIVIGALALVLGGIFGWKYDQAKQTQATAGPPPATVSSTRVRAEQWQPEISAAGSLVASAGVFVTNEIAGQIAEIHFESGQIVNKGDVLVRLDDQTDRAQLDAFIAQQQLAQVRFDRVSRLLKDNMISQSDFDEAKFQLDIAEANVASQRSVVDKKTIRAPFSGRLGLREVNVGQYLAAGSQIVSLQAFDPIYADFTLPERFLSRLATGRKVAVRVQAYGTRAFSGSITAIEPRIETRTRNLRIRATLPNPKSELQPGMFADVAVVSPEKRKVLTLPRVALTYAPYGDSVFVIEDANGKRWVRQRQVQTGEIRGDRIEVISGLKEGDTVVVAGQIKLRDGQPIEIDNSVDLEKPASS